MEGFVPSEIIEIADHELDLSMEHCDLCGGELTDAGETAQSVEKRTG